MDIVFDEVTTEVLSELEKTQKSFWNIPRTTGILLNMFIKMMNAKSALEIGTSNGYSGIWIAKALKETGGRLTTIEYYDKRQSIAVENFKKCGVMDLVRPLQGSACDILEVLDISEKFDFVFIDANKREYVRNFELIKPHLLPNAIIAADNVNSHREKVQTYLDAVMNDEDFQTEILDLPAGLAVSYKL